MRHITTLLLCAALLWAGNSIHAQTVRQDTERVEWLDGYGDMGVSWRVEWQNKKGANPAKSGFLTYAKAFGYFTLPDGSRWQFNDLQITTYTSGLLAGKLNPKTVVNVPGQVAGQRTANVIAVTFRVRMHSVLFWDTPTNFVTDTWTSGWYTYWYNN